MRSKWKRMPFNTESGMLPKECGKKIPIECENKTALTSPATGIEIKRTMETKKTFDMLVLVLSKPIYSCSVIQWIWKITKEPIHWCEHKARMTYNNRIELQKQWTTEALTTIKRDEQNEKKKCQTKNRYDEQMIFHLHLSHYNRDRTLHITHAAEYFRSN